MFAPIRKYNFSLYAEMVRGRGVALAIAATGTAQVVAGLYHVGFPCAFHKTTGIPCPGCGLTRSVLSLLEGNPLESFLLHPFGPPMALALVGILIAGIMPKAPRLRAAAAIERVESRYGTTLLLLILFMLVWALRLAGLLPLLPV